MIKNFNWLPLLLGFSVLFISCSETRKDEISSLIDQMTLEEKVGQMTNLTLTTITKKDSEPEIDPVKLRNVILDKHVGSLQNVVSHAYAIEVWHQLIDTIQSINMRESRLKIPFLYCIDAVHGANYTLNSTIFPHNLALAAARNPELTRLASEITAKEVRASGIRYNFSPVLDVGRQPLWPRFAETFGEDVYLATVMGEASIKGYEGENVGDINHVAACMKHYVGYSLPQSGKDRAPAYIPEIVLREYFLPPFKSAVDAGSRTLMVNSGDVNGVPLHANKYLLTDVLRNELKFKGVIISDWEDIKKLHERHKVAASYKEAVLLSVNAGIDLCIVPFDFQFTDYLIELVKEGRISEVRINESVRRVLELKKELGLFANPYVEKEALKNFALPEYKNAALEAARESVVLLKNDNSALPLKKGKKLLVTGPAANSKTAIHGAWTYTWQGQSDKYFAEDCNTFLQAIKNIAGENNVKYVQGTDFTEKDINIAEAVRAAAGADHIVICIGEDAYAETPGNIADLELPLIQQQLVKALAGTGKPVTLIISEGRPRIIRNIEKNAGSIVLSLWQGSRGADAVAEVLFGDTNPSGKLPFTYPRYAGELLTYDHKTLDEAVEVAEPYSYTYQFNPQYQFGHGLSYTRFEYSDLSIDQKEVKLNGTIKITVTIKNTGAKEGKEVIELYSRDLYASVVPPVKRLRRFQKIHLKPGETKTVEFELSTDDLGFIGQDLKKITEPGEFEVMIGGLKDGFVVTGP
ncbi:MAG: glycoside hydrolase family 3 N-terminal domain-containing protein [Cytophagaceae bacterium]